MVRRIRWGRVFGAVSAVGLLGYGASWLLESEPDVENMVWLERLPRNDRDRIGSIIFVAPPDIDERIGAVGYSSTWQQRTDLFRYGIVRGKARLVFPQDGRKVVLGVKATRCEGRAPEPLDLCLDLTLADGDTVTFYSSEALRLPFPEARPDLPIDPDAVAAPSRITEIFGTP